MANPTSIADNLITYYKTIKDVVYSTDEGTPKYGVTIFHLAFNRTYKRDGGDVIIDENIALLVKLNTKANVEDCANALIDGTIGSQIEDTGIVIKEAFLLTRNPIQKEQESVFYQLLSFRFLGNFK